MALEYTTGSQETDRWLTPDELAQRLQLSPRTIRNWREAAVNKGPRGVRFGKHVRYSLADVEAWENAERAAVSA